MKAYFRGILINLFFFVIFFYNFYRYIFQYNNSETSPTYSDTPLFWQVFKYVLCAIILLFIYLTLDYKKKIKKSILILYCFVFLILVTNIFNFFIYGKLEFNEIEYTVYFILLIPFAINSSSIKDFNINFDKLIFICAIILLSSNFIAISNYYLFGRLPALGYEGGLIRFGGFWDDPNGFGIICVFLFFYYFNKKCYLLSAVLFLSIIPTFSFAAYLLFVASIVFWTVRDYSFIKKKWLLISIFFSFIIALIIIINFQSLLVLYEYKALSMEMHLTSALKFNPIPLINIGLQSNENFYYSFLFNYFPFSIIGIYYFLKLNILTFNNSYFANTKFYLMLFCLGSFSFSLFHVFPLNIIFIVLLIDYLKTNGYKDYNQEIGF